MLLFLIFDSVSVIDIFLISSIVSKHQPQSSVNTMKSAAIATILCYTVAMGMALPSKVAHSESEEFEVQAQWHLRAPVRGCVEVLHIVGGSYFRTYACDGADGEFLVNCVTKFDHGKNSNNKFNVIQFSL